MMWGYYDGASWIWMVGMMLVFWGGLIVLVGLVIRSFMHPARGGDAALDTLRRRLAAGEISQEEFEKIRRALQS